MGLFERRKSAKDQNIAAVKVHRRTCHNREEKHRRSRGQSGYAFDSQQRMERTFPVCILLHLLTRTSEQGTRYDASLSHN